MKDMSVNAEKHLNGHPWEIIYKYLAMIALNEQEPELAEAYMKKTETILSETGYTIRTLVRCGWAEYYLKTGKTAEHADLINEYQNLKSVITYMYC